MTKQRNTTVGIDDMAIYLPKLYLPITTLADARNIAVEKLQQGLGLQAMAIPDAQEDTASMLANAVKELIDKNNLAPQTIGRIYLGTESSLDGAKPTASYALEMLNAYYTPQYGADCFLNCDILDTTFACIGAVDAMQNCLDWIRADQERIAIVVAADHAKYELGSTGEYTQGAGAIAVLLKAAPQLLSIGTHWGTSTKAVYDFYKPIRTVSKQELIKEVLHYTQNKHDDVDAIVKQLDQTLEAKGVLDNNESQISIHKTTPIFDGAYSNACYQARIQAALDNYKQQHPNSLAIHWDRLIFHLPYAYQARRMFAEIFWQETLLSEQKEQLLAELQMEAPKPSTFDDKKAFEKAQALFWRAVRKTNSYQKLVEEKIEKSERASSQVGNMYAASIFLALMSSLSTDAHEKTLSAGAQLGCFAYGSGSKSKVFVARLQKGWQAKALQFKLQEQIHQRQAIDYNTYEALHRTAIDSNIQPSSAYFYLKNKNKAGIRTYFIPEKVKL